MESHVSWAKENSRSLIEVPIKDSIVKETAELLASLGPDEVILVRKRFMKHIRRRADELRQASDERLSKLPRHVRRILSCSGKNKVNLSLLEELGRKYYPEGIETLIKDLENGFPFIGNIPVEQRADLDKVKLATISPEELEKKAEEICQKILSTQPSGKISSEDHKTILAQTKEEISLGRMAELKEATPAGKYPLTKRFAMKQLSSKGTEKLRCIDDYLRSEINAAATVEGRIPMGKINDLLEKYQGAHRSGERRRRGY